MNVSLSVWREEPYSFFSREVGFIILASVSYGYGRFPLVEILDVLRVDPDSGLTKVLPFSDWSFEPEDYTEDITLEAQRLHERSD